MPLTVLSQMVLFSVVVDLIILHRALGTFVDIDSALCVVADYVVLDKQVSAGVSYRDAVQSVAVDLIILHRALGTFVDEDSALCVVANDVVLDERVSAGVSYPDAV